MIVAVRSGARSLWLHSQLSTREANFERNIFETRSSYSLGSSTTSTRRRRTDTYLCQGHAFPSGLAGSASTTFQWTNYSTRRCGSYVVAMLENSVYALKANAINWACHLTAEAVFGKAVHLLLSLLSSGAIRTQLQIIACRQTLHTMTTSYANGNAGKTQRTIDLNRIGPQMLSCEILILCHL